MTVKWDVEKTIRDVRQAAAQGVMLGAESVLSTAISHIQDDPKSGRVYRRRGVSHQASAPGEAPASDTGRLVQSGRTELSQEQLLASVIFSTEYAAALEFGTPRILPRPYARRSLEEKREEIEANIRAKIEAALRRNTSES